MMQTILEKVGPSTWVRLRDLVGEPLDRTTVLQMAASATEGHPITECVQMLRCSTHKRQWQDHSPAFRRAHRKDHPLPAQSKPRQSAVSASDL